MVRPLHWYEFSNSENAGYVLTSERGQDTDPDALALPAPLRREREERKKQREEDTKKASKNRKSKQH